MKQPSTTKPNLDDEQHRHIDGELLVEFPARGRRRHCRADKQVRFASHSTVQPITSVLAVCCKQELWYSSKDVDMMRVEIRRDASALARTLLSPSAKDVEEGIDISQAVGLDRHVNPIMRRSE